MGIGGVILPECGAQLHIHEEPTPFPLDTNETQSAVHNDLAFVRS